MKLGVISDSHDNLSNVEKAVDLFVERQIGAFIHAGDFCSPFVFRQLDRLKPVCQKMYAVFGNNDGDRRLLAKMGMGFCEFGDVAVTTVLDGKNVVIMHYPDVVENLFHSGDFDLVIFGHTHHRLIKGEDKKILNPGSCSGYLTEKATVAVVDLQTMEIDSITL